MPRYVSERDLCGVGLQVERRAGAAFAARRVSEVRRMMDPTAAEG
jgi:hypothetical protein